MELNTAWGDSAYAYLGITVPGFPNFFCMFGPGTNAVNGASIIYNSECQMRYIMGCIDMVLAGRFDSATVRAEVCDDYNRRSQDRLKQMVYSHPAVTSSYYKNAGGRRTHAVRLPHLRLLDVDQPPRSGRLRIALGSVSPPAVVRSHRPRDGHCAGAKAPHAPRWIHSHLKR